MAVLLHSLPHLSTQLGLNLSIKRDDLTDLVFNIDEMVEKEL